MTRTNSLGLALREAIERGIDTGQLAVLTVPDDQRVLLAPAPIVVVTMKERALPPSATAVIDQIRRATTAAQEVQSSRVQVCGIDVPGRVYAATLGQGRCGSEDWTVTACDN